MLSHCKKSSRTLSVISMPAVNLIERCENKRNKLYSDAATIRVILSDLDVA